ncbi:MAG: THUMP domain-containing protein [Candidatus Hodarchaeaceae archaeon]|nr:THUMP domain-containing protein [Candidatus Hodarchaeaceae archaeon]
MAKLIVTSRGLSNTRQTIAALRVVVPGARIRRTGFRGVTSLEADGDVFELAKNVNRECFASVGRATAVLMEVESRPEAIKGAAVKIGVENIRGDEKFCFRLHKRGSHRLEQETPKLEYEIGGAIWTAVQRKYKREPKVDLKNPDVMVIAEVLGPNTAVGILRKAWRAGTTQQAPQRTRP